MIYLISRVFCLDFLNFSGPLFFFCARNIIYLQEKWTRYDAWMKIRQEKYLYLSDTLFNTKEDCVKESYYECATSKILISDFQHWNDCSDCNCTSKCLPSYLHNLFDNETTLHSLARALQ